MTSITVIEILHEVREYVLLERTLEQGPREEQVKLGCSPQPMGERAGYKIIRAADWT